ncbi:hypothetical protein [Mycobacteroides abscessus]|uniref:hypothetical protein n=1 Tax=Mycobacteroides abscessus TaxID=36809 RepID=UPI0009292D82|nr:hypothetical protein [Mycobacteroides abscessus]SIA23301.1 Uncharacterised protein [Mycobacteroides abscessus subsp. abscessus]SKT81403.1 Uncharacterised protein [Mycobacteroides abscessus subsp. massiliense]SKT98767.1 Uncharacterised protein [Mycobacteroides abscessus subsp. massiliense]
MTSPSIRTVQTHSASINTPSAVGQRNNFPQFLLIVIAGIAVLGLGVGCTIRGTTAQNTIAPTSPEPTAVAAVGLTPAQAKQQSCDAYRTLGNQWSTAYQQWLAELPTPWSWNDPAVQTATTRFDTTATQVAAQLATLTDPHTPTEVASAITDVRLQIVNLAASHGQTSTGAETDAKLDAIDRSMATANQICDLN